MKQKLENIINSLKESLKTVKISDDCQLLRVKYLGKSGEITELLKMMKDVPVSEKPQMGALINVVKTQAEELIQDKESVLKEAELSERLMTEKIDVTLDKKSRQRGNMHPISIDLIKVGEILTGLGFSQIDGPEMEYDKYNFELVNIPKDHPSRDMQDTFYITDSILLRTQTSNTQPRAMQNLKPPFKVYSPGMVFRRDEYDATHTPAFHQVEGLYVDKKVSMADLKTTLTTIIRKLLGNDINLRFRSSYFPFTEPSVEVDITCTICNGKGCVACKNVGGFELLGAGLVHPKVLEDNGIDSTIYSGYAFGFGFDRIPKSRYKIPYSRLMYEHDIRFLKQFK